jgi:hypothetical protein
MATLALAGPAAAASNSCGDAVIADWYGDGRVDKVFPLPCYQQAIRSLPVDVLDYSNAKQDILRALAFARKGDKDPGPSGGSQTAGNGGTTDPGRGAGPGGGGPSLVARLGLGAAPRGAVGEPRDAEGRDADRCVRVDARAATVEHGGREERREGDQERGLRAAPARERGSRRRVHRARG